MAGRGRPRKFDREEVLESAKRVFWQKGYEGAALSDLTSAMGLTPPSLYAAFGDKEGLFREAIERYVSNEGSEILGALATQPTARAAIAAMLEVAAHKFADPTSPGGCMLTLSAINCTPEHADLKSEMTARRQMIRARLKTRLERAHAEGELVPDADVDDLAEFYTAVMNGFCLRAKDGATAEKLIKTIDHALAAVDAVTRKV